MALPLVAVIVKLMKAHQFLTFIAMRRKMGIFFFLHLLTIMLNKLFFSIKV